MDTDAYHCCLSEMVEGRVRVEVQFLVQHSQLLLVSLYHVLLFLESNKDRLLLYKM